MNQLTRITQMIQSNKLINSIYCWPFSENLRVRWLFLVFFLINRIYSIIPVAQSQSTQSPILWERIDWITNQLARKRKWINSISFATKMNRFKSINSVELTGTQACIEYCRKQLWLVEKRILLYFVFLYFVDIPYFVPSETDLTRLLTGTVRGWRSDTIYSVYFNFVGQIKG